MVNGIKYRRDKMDEDRDVIREYRKVPVKIKAVRWNGQNLGEVNKLNTLGRSLSISAEKGKQVILLIETLEGTHECKQGNWVIQGVEGEIYPCRDDIFRKTYKVVT